MTSLTTSTVAQTSASPAKKKSTRPKVGDHIRAHASVKSPDFPDIPFAGWTGRIMEVSGRKAPFKYFIEWDDAVVQAMPRSYVDRCEAQQIYHRWACLTDQDFDVID